MRHILFATALATAFTGLSGCDKFRNSGEADVKGAMADVNAIDGTGLSDVMLTVGDPAEAVAYFQRAVAESPDRIDLHRGLAKSLTRAGRATESVSAWKRVLTLPGATNDDRVALADAQLRAGDTDAAAITLTAIPPTFETFERYKLEAIVADSKQDWERADSFYEIAAGLTTTPAGVLNNWGFSKLTRGAPKDAERLFTEALRNDPTLFTAKNNLVLARGAQRNYDLPVVDMTQTERAMLLHTAALSAIKRGDVTTGKGLLQEAIDTHPQHFEAAVRALRALEANVSNG
ncbi:MAG: hypothetical protein CSA72_11630 [Rhodobacterales bacterium]|nr:MAG: hypothetical protein CSA72_11630 [Rhodobacterales bacterium]